MRGNGNFSGVTVSILAFTFLFGWIVGLACLSNGDFAVSESVGVDEGIVGDGFGGGGFGGEELMKKLFFMVLGRSFTSSYFVFHN